MGTYQVKTDSFVQTMKTSIWAKRCWSKGGLMGGGRGWFAKVHLQIIPSTSHKFCTWPLPPSISLPLDQHHVVQIEVSIVCTEGLVSTWYVPKFYLSFYTSFCLSFPIHFIFILSLLFYLFIWFIPTHFLFSLFSHVFIFFNT
jgi:hypothetical protein